MPAGLAFRESQKGKPFEDLNPFLLHTVRRDGTVGTYEYKMTPKMSAFRQALYKKSDAKFQYDPNLIYNKNDIRIKYT